MNADSVREKCPPLVKMLKASRPETPVVLVEDRRYANEWLQPKREAHHSANHAALRDCYDAMVAVGLTGIYYIEGNGLLGDDGEGTIDGSHPNDLGYQRPADVFEPVLRSIQAE